MHICLYLWQWKLYQVQAYVSRSSSVRQLKVAMRIRFLPPCTRCRTRGCIVSDASRSDASTTISISECERGFGLSYCRLSRRDSATHDVWSSMNGIISIGRIGNSNSLLLGLTDGRNDKGADGTEKNFYLNLHDSWLRLLDQMTSAIKCNSQKPYYVSRYNIFWSNRTTDFGWLTNVGSFESNS